MIEVGAFTLAGLMWIGVLISVLRDRSSPRRLRIATLVILAVAVPLVVVAYRVYARG